MIEVVNVIDTSLSEWALPDHLAHYILSTIFEQPRRDSSALVRGRLPDDITLTWLYMGNLYTEIPPADHDKFKRAAKSRGGGYSMELCEFITVTSFSISGVVSVMTRAKVDALSFPAAVVFGHRFSSLAAGKTTSNF
jgi:hypothetical protein